MYVCYLIHYLSMLFTIVRPQPLGAGVSASAGLGAAKNKFTIDDKRNRFQFLKQDLNLDLNQSPVRGSGQSGDDYSYYQIGNSNHGNGYDYSPPT